MNKKFEIITAGLVVIVVIGAIIFANVKGTLNKGKDIFDEKDIIKVPRMMLGEDFSVYQKRIPGVFVFVGAGNEEIGRDYPNHNDKFNIDEKAVLISTQLYVAFALESLGGEEKKQHSNQKLKEEVWN